MTKTATFTVGERVAAMKIFDAFKGSISTLSIIMEDVKKFAVTKEEWDQAELTKVDGKDGAQTWNWKDTIVFKEIAMQNETAEYLKTAIKKKSDEGEITLADIALIELEKKIA